MADSWRSCPGRPNSLDFRLLGTAGPLAVSLSRGPWPDGGQRAPFTGRYRSDRPSRADAGRDGVDGPPDRLFITEPRRASRSGCSIRLSSDQLPSFGAPPRASASCRWTAISDPLLYPAGRDGQPFSCRWTAISDPLLSAGDRRTQRKSCRWTAISDPLLSSRSLPLAALGCRWTAISDPLLSATRSRAAPRSCRWTAISDPLLSPLPAGTPMSSCRWTAISDPLLS